MLALISGCAATRLSEEERQFFARFDPWGLVLFRRNVETPAQVTALCASFRSVVGRPDAPVFVDQEGGRVQRLGPPHWPAYPAAALYAEGRPVEQATEAAWLGGRLIADDLRAVGITGDFAPVLDVRAPGSHDVIGNRSFGGDPVVVATLARAFAQGLMAGGVIPIVKHMPGHGRAGVDSHHDLPLVDTDRETLAATDFAPFRHLADLPVAMTAHVVYTALDPVRPATTSPAIIEGIMRTTLGFAGLLLSDDLSMNALRGSLGERAAAAREAGCDVLLHCNGAFEEMTAVAAQARPLAGTAAERVAAAMTCIRAPDPLDRPVAEARFRAMLGQAEAA